MCGLYGYTSKNYFISNNEAEIFNKLSSSAEVRGKEACGSPQYIIQILM